MRYLSPSSTVWMYVGTILLLSTNLQAQSLPPDSPECPIQRLGVYLQDPDTTGTNIRETPAGTILQVVKNDPLEEVFIMFEVCEMKGNWLLVMGLHESSDVRGWIHNSVVATTLRAYGSPVPVFSHSDDSHSPIDQPSREQRVKILESSGAYAKIRYLDDAGNVKEGYVKHDDLCGNPYTTCA